METSVIASQVSRLVEATCAGRPRRRASSSLAGDALLLLVYAAAALGENSSGENRWRRGSVSTVVSGDPSDDELLRATAAGDRRAFEQYYRRNAPWLEIRLRRRCGDAELAADVLQEVFLAVWRAAASYRGNGQAGGWLWSIASRRLIDAHRRRRDRSNVAGEPHDDLMRIPSAEETALADTYDARLAQALSGLSPELRAVLQATVLDGLSVRETSVLLNVPEGTVKSRASRARRQLREALA